MNLVDELLNEAKEIANELGVELTVPRITARQKHRSNHPAETATDYWKRALLIPYLDSLITSLNTRFSESNAPAYSLLLLHPANMLNISVEDLKVRLKDCITFYRLKNLDSEIDLWHKIWADKKLSKEELKDLELCDLVKETKPFFPHIKRALNIALAQPCTTCTIERSFSTLRRVKTWIRSTMTEDRLNGNNLENNYRIISYLCIFGL